MEENFKIYVDRLREGREEKISFTVDASFIGVPSEFLDPVRISGVAYLAHSHLILRLRIDTMMRMVCAMCNEFVNVQTAIDDFYQTVELAKIPHFVFNFEDLVRDAILLQLPHTVECNGGNCPDREQLQKYFSKESRS